MNNKEYQSKKRQKILNYLMRNSSRHITAQELMQALNDGEQRISKATIYRYLDNLYQKGILYKYETSSGDYACFQYKGDAADTEHFHLKCTQCGSLVHMQCDFLQDVSSHLMKEHHFRADPHKTIFYGTCAQCAQEESL